ncbi:MAG: 2-isopropylmalate synthase [Spirochaetes bacterium]|nr:2-isopropylmalate synthase [Spirochaetota bacterium]
MKEYEIRDSEKPLLFEDTFPYTIPPLIRFDGPIKETVDEKERVFDPRQAAARDIHVTDTTFRDGQQSRPPYSVEQTVRIFEMLSRLGGKKGIVRQTEFFVYTKQDREKIESCRALGLKYPEITGWIRASTGELLRIKETGLSETGILTSCSDYHIFHKLNKTRKQAASDYLKVVEAALSAGIRPRCHLEDITRADITGFVVPFVDRLERLTENMPEHSRVKIRLCDTMGFGLPYPGVCEPRSVLKLLWRIREECGVPSDRIEWHGHNDFHKVHANGVCAWICGADALNATLFGIGERTGNPPLEGAVIELISLKGEIGGADLSVITELADYYTDVFGPVIPPSYPFAGRDFNTTRAGIHAGGLRKNERIYNVFDTTALLGRKPRVAITDKSGTDGVAVWVNDFLGLEGKNRLTLSKVACIQRWVMDQYEKEGRLTAISEEELQTQVRRHFPEEYKRSLNRKR